MVEDWDKIKSKVILNKRQTENAHLFVPSGGEKYCVKKDIISILRQIWLQKNDGKIVESMDDQMLKMQIQINGFEMNRGIAIEIKG